MSAGARPLDAQPAVAPEALALPSCYWVLPGRLLAGEYPGGESPELTRARVSRLIEAGVTSFLDLTQPRERAPYDALLPAGIDYLRKPIPDHGLPAQPADMAAILAQLREALRSERVIYLHCRAGIGRTNTVAGCLLAEQGFSGDGALAELNRLWRLSGRSAEWPTIPETPEQADYVRRWTPSLAERDPLFDPDTLDAARGLRERFQGALLGLAAGDAVAAATQYRRPGSFTAVGDMLGGGPFDLPRGGWSDDTALALCLAESLIECEQFDARDQMRRYQRWQQQGHLSATGQCVGITAATARALALAQWRRQPFSGSHDPAAQDADVLSRVVPVVMYFFARPEEAAERSADAARTTCQAPLALAACRSLAQGLHAALSGSPKATVLERAKPPGAPRARGSAAAVPAESAAAALATALDVLDRTQTFREAVLAAANLGGNSDVLGAIVGALAGAHYTASAVPASWRNSLMKKQLIEGIADRLLVHAMLGLGA